MSDDAFEATARFRLNNERLEAKGHERLDWATWLIVGQPLIDEEES